MEWLGEGEGKLSSDYIKSVILAANDTIDVPLGHACVWTYMPKDGSIDEPEKSSKGKLIFQWLLTEKPPSNTAPLAAQEIHHTATKHMTAQGSKKPWSDITESLLTWVGRVQSGLTT